MQYLTAKGEDEVVDYGLDWAPALSLLNDPTITASSWTVRQGTVELSGSDFDSTRTNIRVRGGEAGEEAILRNLVTLSNGEAFHEDAFLKIT